MSKYVVQGSVEERIMEMVQQRKQGVNSQEASTSRGFTWADLGALHNASDSRVSITEMRFHALSGPHPKSLSWHVGELSSAAFELLLTGLAWFKMHCQSVH